MRALVAASDEVTRLTLEHLLRDFGYEVELTGDGEAAWAVMQGDDPPPLCLLGCQLPGMPSRELVTRLRGLRTRPGYVLLLAGKRERDELAAALAAGADDYVQLPVDKQELRVRLRAGRRIVELGQTLHAQACRDALTGALNRGAVIELAEWELARARREEKSLGMLMADVDHFKQLNRGHGTLVGDAALRAVAGVMGVAVRAYDAMGRYSGDKFMFVLSQCTAASLAVVAERLRQRVAAATVEAASGPLSVSISLGGAVLRQGARTEVEKLLRTSNDALERARLAGGNRVEIVEVEVDS